MYCKECVLTDIVTQKAQLAKHAQQRAVAAQKRAERVADDAEAARAAEIAAFERTEKQSSAPAGDSKRKRGDEGQDASSGASADAKRVRDERADASRDTAAFWLPTRAPEIERDETAVLEEQDRPSTPLCVAGAAPHKLTAKGLIDVRFSVRTVEGTAQLYCPCCKKEFSTASQTHVLRPCGHVLCASCTQELVRAPMRRGEATACPECNATLKRERDVVAIAREGTGYASGGTSEVRAAGVAFQG